jgi:hypothetical protein
MSQKLQGFPIPEPAMRELRCTKCQYTWTSEYVEQLCPNCDERVQAYRRNAWIEKRQLADRREAMYGRRTSDRQRCCEECEAPLKGYSELEYDPGTGIAVIVCDNCQFEHVIEEGVKS